MGDWIIKKEEHIIERIEERARNLRKNIDAREELNRIKKLLEDNVPPDWRLTRFSSDFLIRDLKLGITLVGHQTRKENSTTILKHINTALLTGGFSKGKLGKHAGSPDAFEIAKRPNLFIGDESIHSIFQISPILARQYEKVYYSTLKTEFKVGNYVYPRFVQAKSPIEYFRLHSVCSSGIDPNSFVWMKWISNGFYSLGANPPKGYHGEDFWLLQVEK